MTQMAARVMTLLISRKRKVARDGTDPLSRKLKASNRVCIFVINQETTINIVNTLTSTPVWLATLLRLTIINSPTTNDKNGVTFLTSDAGSRERPLRNVQVLNRSNSMKSRCIIRKTACGNKPYRCLHVVERKGQMVLNIKHGETHSMMDRPGRY